MAERKSTGNRGSLMELGRPRLGQTPLAAPLEEVEQRILPTAATPVSQPAEPEQERTLIDSEFSRTFQTTGGPPPAEAYVQPVYPSSQQGDLLSRLRKNRQPIAVVGFKLPAALKEEMLAVAQHNGTDMTRLVVAALERLLPELPHPPSWKKHKG